MKLRGQKVRDCRVPANSPDLLTCIDSKSGTIPGPNTDVREERKEGRKEGSVVTQNCFSLDLTQGSHVAVQTEPRTIYVHLCVRM